MSDGLKMTTPAHACKMPRWRSRWSHRVYVCDCGGLWTAQHFFSQVDVGFGVYRWKRVDGGK